MSKTIRVFRPRGIDIYIDHRARRLSFRGPKFLCTIKSKGRTGAAIRSRLMRMTPSQRDSILAAWLQGEAVSFPAPG